MSQFGAFAAGVQGGASVGTQILNNRRAEEQQTWARYQHERGVEGDKLNAVMNVATSQFDGDIDAMASSPAGLNVIFDFMKDDPKLKAQLESNTGWTPAGMYRDAQTGGFGIVLEDENGTRKNLTVDRASGTASFVMTPDDFYTSFAAAAGRTGNKDTLTTHRALSAISNMQGIDQEKGKAAYLSGEGGPDVPVAASLANVSKSVRDNKATRDANQTATNTANAPTNDPKATSTDVLVSEKEATKEAPLGSVNAEPKKSEQSAEDVTAKIDEAVASGALTQEQGDDITAKWNAGGLSVNGVLELARQNAGETASRQELLGQVLDGTLTVDDAIFTMRDAPKRNDELGSILSGESTPDDVRFAMANEANNNLPVGEEPSLGNMITSGAKAGARDLLAQTPQGVQDTVATLGNYAQDTVNTAKDLAPEVARAASNVASDFGGYVSGIANASPVVKAGKAIAEAFPEGGADFITNGRLGKEFMSAVEDGDAAALAKTMGTSVRETLKTANGLVDGLSKAQEEGYNKLTGWASKVFDSFSEGLTGVSAKDTELASRVIESKTKDIAKNSDQPTKAKIEAQGGKIPASTANDPDKLASTTNVVRAQVSGLTMGERVINDKTLYERAFSAPEKLTASKRYAANYLFSSGVISEGAYRQLMDNGSWTNSDREVAMAELSYREQYVRNQVSLQKARNAFGTAEAKRMDEQFKTSLDAGTIMVSNAIASSYSLQQAAGGVGTDSKGRTSGTSSSKYAGTLLDSYLEHPTLLSHYNVKNKRELSDVTVNQVAKNLATSITNGKVNFQRASKAEDASFFSAAYWDSDKEGINPMDMRIQHGVIQGWFETTTPVAETK